MNDLQQQLKDRIKEEINYVDEDLKVHFSTKGDKFHIDVIEDYVSHMHIRGTTELEYCIMITSISSQLTNSNTASILRVVADLMEELGE